MNRPDPGPPRTTHPDPHPSTVTHSHIARHVSAQPHTGPVDIPAAYAVPLGSWTHDDTGMAIIKAGIGEELWANARELTELRDRIAKAYAEVDKQLRVIIAGGPGLRTKDGRPLATLTRTATRTLDRKKLAAESGLDLDAFYIPSERTTIALAPSLEPRRR